MKMKRLIEKGESLNINSVIESLHGDQPCLIEKTKLQSISGGCYPPKDTTIGEDTIPIYIGKNYFDKIFKDIIIIY
jgi:hypothetical protein